MEAPERARGMRRRRPPVGGTFWFQIFIPASSPEIWRKTISGADGGSGEEVGWPVLGYVLGKDYRRRDRDRLVPPRWMDAAVYRAEVCYPFGPKHGKASGSETARLHHARWRRGGVAARGARAAVDDAGDWIS